MASTIPEQRYGPTSGTVTGWAGLVLCAIFVVAFLISGHDLVTVRWVLGFAAVAVVLWSMMLRPQIIVRPPLLVLRNPFSTWSLPMAAVEVVQVRAFTRVVAGGRAYDAVAVGRRMRKMVGRPSPGGVFGIPDPGPDPRSRHVDVSTPDALADLMTEQILRAADDARASGEDPGTARRTWAWPELALLGVLVVAIVVTLLL